MTIADFMPDSDARDEYVQAIADTTKIKASAVTIENVRPGSVVVTTSVGFLNSETSNQHLLNDALKQPEVMFANTSNPFFSMSTGVSTIASEDRTVQLTEAQAPIAMTLAVGGIAVAILFTAMAGLFQRSKAKGFIPKLKELWQQRRLVINLFSATFDFASDALFAASLAGVPYYSFYFLYTVACLGGHMVVASVVTCYVVLVAYHRQKPGNEDGPLLDWKDFMGQVGLYGVILVMAVTNLEVLVCLPWKKKNRAVDYDGFPERWLMRLTYISVIVEDLPQLVIQAMFIVREGGSMVTYISMGFSFTSFLIRFVIRAIVQLNGVNLFSELSHMSSSVLERDIGDFPYNEGVGFDYNTPAEKLTDPEAGQRSDVLQVNSAKVHPESPSIPSGKRPAAHDSLKIMDCESEYGEGNSAFLDTSETSRDIETALRPGTEKCAICMELPASHCIVPCGHKCICASCAPKIEGRGARNSPSSSSASGHQPRCPICNGQVQSTMKIFESGVL